MNFKSTVFITLITLLVKTSTAYAIESYLCDLNPDNNLVEGSSYGKINSISNSQGIANFTEVLTSPDVSKCDDVTEKDLGAISDSDVSYAELTFSFNSSASIDFNRSVTSDGKTYYGLKGTGSDFLNTYGYIYFKIASESGSSSTAVQKSTLRYRGAIRTTSHGIQVDSISISFFDTAGNPISGPKEELDSVSIDLGQFNSTLRVSWSNPDGYIILYGGRQNVYITLNILPSLAESCSVSSENVRLPPVPAGNLRSEGEEIGGEPFTITATCAAEDAGKTLMYTMMDNNAPLNVRSEFLTNTVTATDNVGVAVYDHGENIVTYGTTNSFGVLSGGPRPTVSKRFLARYRKLDNEPVTPGLLNAQATIMVNYE